MIRFEGFEHWKIMLFGKSVHDRAHATFATHQVTLLLLLLALRALQRAALEPPPPMTPGGRGFERGSDSKGMGAYTTSK